MVILIGFLCVVAGSQSLINQGYILTPLKNLTHHLIRQVAIPYKSGIYSYKKLFRLEAVETINVAIPYKSGIYSYNGHFHRVSLCRRRVAIPYKSGIYSYATGESYHVDCDDRRNPL